LGRSSKLSHSNCYCYNVMMINYILKLIWLCMPFLPRSMTANWN
jgi:hypothetical protein